MKTQQEKAEKRLGIRWATGLTGRCQALNSWGDRCRFQPAKARAGLEVCRLHAELYDVLVDEVGEKAAAERLTLGGNC